MPENIDLSIIIVNYNVKSFLQSLLLSLQKAITNITNEIIVVDNASTDGSVEFIKNNFPSIKIISNKKNLGFSKANNQGIEIAEGKYCLLLNPDTIVSEDTFSKMIKFFERNPKVGLSGCKILNPDGTLQLACRRSFPGPWTSFCKITGLSSLFPKSKLFARYNLTYCDENVDCEVDAVSGSFMMFPTKIINEIGGLDEDFFMYGEDLDFCYRIQKAGYKIYYVSTTQIIHYKGESTKRSSLDETRLFYKAMHLFVKKHLSTSFLVAVILDVAIFLRGFISFLNQYNLIIIGILLDALFFETSLFVAEKIYMNYNNWLGFPIDKIYIIYSIPLLIQLFVSFVFGLYNKNKLSILKNVGAFFIGFILLSSITFFFKQYAYSRAVVLITYTVFFLTSNLWRLFYRAVFKFGILNDEIKIRNVLIVGTDSFSFKLVQKLQKNIAPVYRIKGFISKSFNDVGRKISNYEILGTIENISKIIKSEKINEVIFSTTDISYLQIMKTVSGCKKNRVEFKLTGENIDFMVGKTSIIMLDNLPLFEITNNLNMYPHKIIKSIFDFILSSLIMLFIFPFIYLIFNKKKEKSEFIIFILNIPSVFFGKKSFVGPKLDENNGYYFGKKGLTGLWYTDAENNQNEKLDIFYARNQNIWLDIDILRKTLLKMRKN